MVLVVRRGLEPLISRMKTWRPNRLDERTVYFWDCKITNFPEYSKIFFILNFNHLSISAWNLKPSRLPVFSEMLSIVACISDTVTSFIVS